ncbi:DDE-type integrase/transposase/recombinase [Streptomyces sp. NPDC005799]|uniref:DDE-type integrase/transposase/recombinase n=1 Tax=Streptomyces sp. NPDC005799 TaxID=3154678 RepID=UPI0033CC441F
MTRPGKRPAAPDFVRRDFTAEESDLVWAGDMTEIDTGEGKLYLATVIDLFSRRLLGYAMGERHDAELVMASLNMAAATRGGDVRGVIMHRDGGSRVLLPDVPAGLPQAGRHPVRGQSWILFRLSVSWYRIPQGFGSPGRDGLTLATTDPEGVLALICRPSGRARSKRCRRPDVT